MKLLFFRLRKNQQLRALATWMMHASNNRLYHHRVRRAKLTRNTSKASKKLRGCLVYWACKTVVTFAARMQATKNMREMDAAFARLGTWRRTFMHANPRALGIVSNASKVVHLRFVLSRLESEMHVGYMRIVNQFAQLVVAKYRTNALGYGFRKLHEWQYWPNQFIFRAQKLYRWWVQHGRNVKLRQVVNTWRLGARDLKARRVVMRTMTGTEFGFG